MNKRAHEDEDFAVIPAAAATPNDRVENVAMRADPPQRDGDGPNAS